MLDGHITLKVFAGFVVTLTGLGAFGFLGALLPLVMVVALTALEFLVAFLQAYVFTILTCMYLNDALHRGTEDGSTKSNCIPNIEVSAFPRSLKWIHRSEVHRRWPLDHRYRRCRHRPRQHLRQLPVERCPQPSAADGQFGRLILGFAVTEALGIFSLLIALLLLFAV